MSLFSEQEYLRYTRHIQLPQVGASGQTKLKNARVLIVGCGGLGAPVSLYLAAAGIGTITLVDNDTIELSNLQRQISYSEADIGQQKASVTAQQLAARNHHINVHPIVARFDTDNAQALIDNADIVLDCTDNFSTRYLINKACRQAGKPWVYASIYQFSGQCALFTPQGPCYQCLYPEAPENIVDCNTGGVLGVLPGILGTIQANECIKFLLGLLDKTANKLMLFETLDMSCQSIELMQDPNCPCCSTEALLNKSPHSMSTEPNQNEMQPTSETNMKEIASNEFTQLASDHEVTILDVRTPEENTAYNLADRCQNHIHLPLNELVEATRNNALDLEKDKPYAVYCQAGGRSRQAVSILSQLGYDATNIQGGLQAILAEP